MGIHRQSQAPSASPRKPHFEVKGHPKFYEKLERLRRSTQREDKQLVRQIDNAITVLEEKPTAGEAIQRDRWPDEYRNLKVPSLFRYRLSSTHRMIYSIHKISSDAPFVWIIDTMDHDRYDQLFGYK